MNLCDPSVIREIMGKAGIRFKKGLGQNFLINQTVPERIAQCACPDGGEDVLEIGPGIGCLTSCLCARAGRVLAVEIDRGLIPVLSETLAECSNIEIVNADIMKTDISELLGSRGMKSVKVCANLPYYITSPIIMCLLECGYGFDSITVMVQNEVAARLTAKPGSADYGAITAVIGYYGEAEKLFGVSRGNFVPAPHVDSAVVGIRLYSEPKYLPADKKLFFGIIKAAFLLRRKTLVNALASAYPEYSKAQTAAALRSLGFPEDIRGERLSTGDFCRLSDLLSSAGTQKSITGNE